MLAGHEARSRKSLALLEDAKASAQGFDFQALHVIHRLQRTLESSLGEAERWDPDSSDNDEVAGALAVAIVESARDKVMDIVREALTREPSRPAMPSP
jgi:hypothetical protein